MTGTHFHDLRHTGNVFTAGTGATLRELMDRMGHSSTRAAMIYMHGADARQHEIADTLSKLARQELQPRPKASTSRSGGKRSGTQRHERASVPLDGDGGGYQSGGWPRCLGGGPRWT
jgi:hypothetical protein